MQRLQGVPKTSHYQVSSLNRIKNLDLMTIKAKFFINLD